MSTESKSSVKDKIQDSLLRDGVFVTSEAKANKLSNAELRRRGLVANVIGATLLAGSVVGMHEIVHDIKENAAEMGDSQTVHAGETVSTGPDLQQTTAFEIPNAAIVEHVPDNQMYKAE